MARRNDMALAPGAIKWYGGGVNSENSMAIKHKFVSSVPDGVNTGEVRPSNWNDSHKIELGEGNIFLGGSDGLGAEVALNQAIQGFLAGDRGVRVFTGDDNVIKVAPAPDNSVYRRLYPSTGGNAIGDATLGGGLAAAFNGASTASAAACANKNASSYVQVGQNCSTSPIMFAGAIVYGSNDNGFVTGDDPLINVTLRGRNDGPFTGPGQGTVLGITSFTDTANGSKGQAVVSTDTYNKWNYVIAELTTATPSNWRIAEVVFYTYEQMPISRLAVVASGYWMDVRDEGVTFDDYTDDTDAWNRVIAKINNGLVKSWRCPNGFSRITRPLDSINASQWSIIGPGGGACRLRYPSGAGDNCRFFTIGDTISSQDWNLSGIGFTCSNTAEIVTPAPAIKLYQCVRSLLDMLRFDNTPGGVQIGDAATVKACNQTFITRGRFVNYTPVGAKAIDIQASASHTFGWNYFGGTGTAHPDFYGLHIHPDVNNTSDAGTFTACEWNYPAPDPNHIVDFDATQRHIASQRFVACVFDQGDTGCNVRLHIDAGAAQETFFNSIDFVGCISNGSTLSNTVILDNSGNKPFTMSWTGGQISSISPSKFPLSLIGGYKISARFNSVQFIRRSTTGASNGSIYVANGVSGWRFFNCTMETRNNAIIGDTPFVQPKYFVYIDGDASNYMVVNCDASLAALDVIYDVGVSAANKTTAIVGPNMGPSGPTYHYGPLIAKTGGIITTTAVNGLELDNYGNGVGSYPSLGLYAMAGTAGSPADVSNGAIIGGLNYYARLAGVRSIIASQTVTYKTGGVTYEFWDTAGNVIFKIDSDFGHVDRVYTVSTLPSAASAGMGARSFVSDGAATTFNTIAAGGGSNKLPVFSDGTNWRYG